MSKSHQKPLSKTAQTKADRAARKIQRAAMKAQEQIALQELRERAVKLCAAPPHEYQDWGVTRTQAFLKFATITRNKAALKTIKSDRLGVFVAQLERVNSWPLEYCQYISKLSDTARTALQE
ncbi:hypothetical protein ACCQ08_03070 [Comamonas sp. SY3]|uniref:hypothetical protein n=1 Tax=Comamonas sp. SY3 TaxID=3243601 RepID=UPI003592F28F